MKKKYKKNKNFNKNQTSFYFEDYLEKNKIPVFGPNRYAAKLEGSKAFMKKLCFKREIPTAKFKICKNKTDVFNFLSKKN